MLALAREELASSGRRWTAESKLTTVLEALSVDELDEEAVKTGLAQYSAAYASATEDVEKAEAEIGVEVYQPPCPTPSTRASEPSRGGRWLSCAGRQRSAPGLPRPEDPTRSRCGRLSSP